MIVVMRGAGSGVGRGSTLVDGSEVGEEHMHAATPVVCLPWPAFECDGWLTSV